MAVAGSAMNSSLTIEAPSSLPRRCAKNEKQSTSVLQMWRELEVDHITSSSQPQVGGRSIQENAIELITNLNNTHLSTGSRHGSVHSLIDSNEKENERIISPRGRQTEHDDTRSSSSECTDYSEVERERLREVFREWQNNGLRNNTSTDSHSKNSSKEQWLGEKECERVRIVREWVNKNTHQRDRCHGGREGQDSETGAQIDHVREGLIVDQCETRPTRTIRRLCGRQTLLDLLMRAEKERRRELQDLLNHKHVSDFPYRNRIQSLLKGRFLRNKPYNREEKPSSLAASELGILRQKQTVSGLREGFLSTKSENYVSDPSGSVQFDSSSHGHPHSHSNEKYRANSVQDIVQDEFCCHSEPDSEETDTNLSKTEDSECDVSEGSHLQDSEALVGESRDVLVLQSENREQLSSTVRLDATRTFASQNSWRSTDDRQRDTLGIEGSEQDHLEGTIIEDMSWQNIPIELEDWHDSVIEEGDIDWVQLSIGNYTGWREASEDGIDTNSHASSHQEYVLGIDSEHFHLQVPQDEWHENASNDVRDDWSDGPSVEEVAGIDVSHFSDDDNGQSLELRQLLSRRRVSNLLRSDFRASLDQLIQSYVERRDHAPIGWEADGASSSPPAVIEGQEQRTMGQSETFVSTTLPTVILPSPQVISSQTRWEHNANQQQPNSLQQSRIQDWEIVNDLRLDMAMLHHRMNSMQLMLEACMDMQLELQRSIRQEVSAALNWQSRSADCEDNLVPDESNLEHVKNGVCCICCDDKIDSLLYRCGHMCTCSKCAQRLIEGKDKCPICRAPVVEYTKLTQDIYL
ncbi:Ring/U-Box superfamily protein [Heracleum sosnowskyi]|uniref:Ring/U-Box superfamily protein n=1 Tax=Heracleum sosnowskyi TaxID=360622 RepID=A0AAD8MIS0_9APIA|nr:Ring/U-Box superfamily protein [Heracleum sosnowskyi]